LLRLCLLNLGQGACVAMLSLCYQALTAAKSSEALTYTVRVCHSPRNSFQNADSPAEDDSDTYNYSYFHLIFLLGSLYMGMLLTGWRNIESA